MFLNLRSIIYLRAISPSIQKSGVLADGITRKQVVLPHPDKVGTIWKGERAYSKLRFYKFQSTFI